MRTHNIHFWKKAAFFLIRLWWTCMRLQKGASMKNESPFQYFKSPDSLMLYGASGKCNLLWVSTCFTRTCVRPVAGSRFSEKRMPTCKPPPPFVMMHDAPFNHRSHCHLKCTKTPIKCPLSLHGRVRIHSKSVLPRAQNSCPKACMSRAGRLPLIMGRTCYLFGLTPYCFCLGGLETPIVWSIGQIGSW